MFYIPHSQDFDMENHIVELDLTFYDFVKSYDPGKVSKFI